MDPKDLLKLHHLTSAVCAISLFGDLPGERVLREGEPDPGGGGGGGGGEPPKTFTQEDVDRIVTQRLSSERKKFADYDQLKEQAGKVPELSKQLEELNEKLELAGKGEEEKQRLLAEKLQAKIEREKDEIARERDEAQAAAQAAAQALRTTRIEHQLTAALTTGKALPSAIEKATRIFMQDAQIEVDEDTGRVTSVTLDDVPYSDLTKATEAFLKANPYFAAAPQGGGGTRNPNGGGGGKSRDRMSPRELAMEGLAQLGIK